jgi:cysteine desulfurase
MGLPAERIESSFRISWCHLTPPVDWDEIVSVLRRLRQGQ